MPNTLGLIVFYGWPLIAAAMFLRLKLEHALLGSIVAGYLLLPSGFEQNVPLLPTYDKRLAVTVGAFGMCLLLGARPGARWLPASRLAALLLAAYLLSPILTVLTNGDAVRHGPRLLPALRPYDIGAFFYEQFFIILPFILARRYLGSEDGQRTTLLMLAASAVLYSFPILLEIRLSPQLHNWVYGYYPFEFAMHRRGGGFRPVVFLQHGLWTAVFVVMGAIAAAALWRATRRPQFFLAGGWLLLVLFLSNSLGALIIGALFAPFIFFSSARLRLSLAAAVAAFVLLYPQLRSIDVVPTGTIVDAAAAISPQRAGSLDYRFENEDILIAHANDRPLFGWGGWSRSRVFDEDGRNVSTVDGRWVIVFGNYGWVGYLAEYGLLTLPIFVVALRRRRDRFSEATIGLCMVLAANLIDLLVNGTLTPLTWLAAGALLGRIERGATREAETAGATETTRPRIRSVYGALPEPGRIGAAPSNT